MGTRNDFKRGGAKKHPKKVQDIEEETFPVLRRAMGDGAGPPPTWNEIMGELWPVISSPLSPNGEQLLWDLIRHDGDFQVTETGDEPHSLSPSGMLRSLVGQGLARIGKDATKGVKPMAKTVHMVSDVEGCSLTYCGFCSHKLMIRISREEFVKLAAQPDSHACKRCILQLADEPMRLERQRAHRCAT